MNKTVTRIGFILAFLILLPAGVFTWLELSSLSSSEEMIERIYNNQLDAILYSVNQFSEDRVSSWNVKLETIVNNKRDSITTAFNKFIKDNKPVKFLFIADTSEIITFAAEHPDSIQLYKSSAQQLINSNPALIKRLYQYSKEGYKKIEPVSSSELKDITIVLAVMDPPNEDKLIGIGITGSDFIKEILSFKIRGVSQNEFILSAFNKSTGENIFSTEQVDISKIQNERKLWLFPSYSLGIMLKGGTIRDYVRSRTETNLLLVSIVGVVLIIGTLLVFRNIRKEVKLAQIKSEFVSNVSHELRTPLALISMFSETLEMGRIRTEEKRNEYYSIIHHEAGRLSKIVNRILNFSQMEAGKRKFSFDKVQLNEITESVFNTYKFHLQNNGFTFNFIPEEGLPLINADREAVAEAIINMVDNAVKYSGDTKVVELSTGMIGSMVYIKIRDKGIGISEQDQKKIFDKFFRVSTGDIHNIKGTGLGLSLVKHIMDAHHGEITLHSTQGTGSSFILKFNQ